ncbi:MAG: RluA family pseudouridine synthase [Clostridia bacterium]|nr:RluA family pseudouridine synthase [Clostridia bacterium]
MTTLSVREEDGGLRLDSFLSVAADISRSAAVRLIEGGNVLLNGAPADKKARLSAGDEVSYEIPAPRETGVEAQDIPLRVLYEDDDLLVIDKPSGMVVHPAAGNEEGTLVNALLHHCGDSLSGVGGELRPGIVHRIDKDTSGLIAVAKNDAAHRSLAAQLEDRSMHRIYHALVNGGFSEDEGTIDLPIGRHPKDRKKMAVLREGQGNARRAVTHYRVLARYGAVSYLALRLETGRTHQIRVHMAAKGHPLLGDTVYGGGHTAFEKKHAALLSGQCLHAKELTFVHPRTGDSVTVTSELPPDFVRLLTILEAQNT